MRHPDWLHKKLLEKNDIYKQKKINELFTSEGKRQVCPPKSTVHIVSDSCFFFFLISYFSPLFQVSHQPLEAGQVADMEDFGMPARPLQPAIVMSTKRKRASQGTDSQVQSQDVELTQSWREILGPPPPMGKTRVSLRRWLWRHAVFLHMTWQFHKCLGSQQVCGSYFKSLYCALYTGGDTGVATLPQKEVGASAEAEEGEEEEEETAGWWSSACRRRCDPRWSGHRPGELPPQDSSQHPWHALADCAGGWKFLLLSFY